MKKIAILAAISLALSACNDNAAKADTSATKTANTAEKTQKAPAKLESMSDKASYSMGHFFAQEMQNRFDSIKKYDVTIDNALFLEGLKDGLAKTGRFTDEELAANMDEFQKHIQAGMKAEQEKKLAEAKAAAEKQLKAGEEYRAEYAKQEGVKTTESGLMYKVLEKGKGGKKPVAADEVKVHYKGTFIDGKQFDSSYDRGNPTSFPLGGVIKGWTEGLQLMEVGDKFEFVIPADIAYGEDGRGGIPGNATLVFVVELLDINPSK